MTKDKKLPKIQEVKNESNQLTFSNIEQSGMKRCTVKEKIIGQLPESMARPAKRKTGLRQNI
jgi:hypothetical protein